MKILVLLIALAIMFLLFSMKTLAIACGIALVLVAICKFVAAFCSAAFDNPIGRM